MRSILTALILVAAQPLVAATFLVTNTSATGPGSLHQAVMDANASPGADVIHFAIPGTGPHLITVSAGEPLPEITDPVTIDGKTQPGYGGSPVVIFSARVYKAFVIRTNDSVIRGLSIASGSYNSTVDVYGDRNTIEDSILTGGYRGQIAIFGDENLVQWNTAERFIFVSGMRNRVLANLSDVFLYNASNNLIEGNTARVIVVNAEAHRNVIVENYVDNIVQTIAQSGGGSGAGNVFRRNKYASPSSIDIYDAPNDPGDADIGGVNNLQNTPVLSNAVTSGGGVKLHASVDSAAAGADCLVIEFHRGRYVSSTPPYFQTFEYAWSHAVNGSSFDEQFFIPIQMQPGERIAATVTSYRGLSCNEPHDGTSEFSSVTILDAQCEAPTITATSSDVLSSGGSVELFVDAVGTDLAYRWSVERNGAFEPISDATTSRLTVSPTETSRYRVTVSNSCGIVDSRIITITVCTPPSFVLRSDDETVVAGMPVHFSIDDLLGSEPMTIDWMNGEGAVIATDVRTLTVTPAASFSTSVRVRNDCGETVQATETIVCAPLEPRLTKTRAASTDTEAFIGIELTLEGGADQIAWYEETGPTRRLIARDTFLISVPARKPATYVVRVTSRCEEVEKSLAIDVRKRPVRRP